MPNAILVCRTQKAPMMAASAAAKSEPSTIEGKSGIPARKSSAAAYAPPA